MFGSAAYGAHMERWDRALHRGRMTWLDRIRVRWSVRRRYRSLGLAPPPGVFVSSPFAAAIVAGVGAGVRWLQRHPEDHLTTCGARLDPAGLVEEARTVVEQVARELGPALDAADIVAALREIIAAPPRVLPRFARAIDRPREPIAAAPALAASEGRLDARLLGEPIENARDIVAASEAPEMPPPFIAVVPQAVDDTLARVACPASFLGRVLAAWLQTRGSVHAAAVVAAFGRRGQLGRDARDALRITRGAGRVFVHADFWVAADRPTTTAHDTEGRLHCVDGPAVAWRDGAGLGFLHGIHVDMRLLTSPLTLADVLGTHNAEIRRVLIERYDRGEPGRFVREADAEVIAFDYDRLGNRRRLLRIPLAGDEPYVAVEVTNSTPEPDGSNKRYILRVPPTITSCREAVAWTFGMTGAKYDPDIET